MRALQTIPSCRQIGKMKRLSQNGYGPDAYDQLTDATDVSGSADHPIEVL